MPSRIVSDQTVRLVRVEHTCKNGGRTYWAVAMTHRSGEFDWGDQGPFCRYCTEQLPRMIEDAEKEQP